MEEIKKTVLPIEDKAVTHTAFFGNEKANGILVECVASFGNMMNYINTPTQKYKMGTDEKGNPTTTIVMNDYDFVNSKEYKLLYSQTLKIVVDGKEVDKTKDNFNKVLDREKTIFKKALLEILKESDDIGFTLANLAN